MCYAVRHKRKGIILNVQCILHIHALQKVPMFLSELPTKVMQMPIYDDQILNVHVAVINYVCIQQIESPKADFHET